MALRLIKLIISIILHLLDMFYNKCLILFRSNPRKISVVVYYHSVPAEQRKRFAGQLDEVIRHARPYSLDSISSHQEGIYNVAVTFDDGFVSVIENAAPELIKRNIPFTVFIPTGYLGMAPPWIQDSSPANREFIMSVEQLKSLSRNDLVSVGSHCFTHTNLLSLEKNNARNEISISKHHLENILQKEIIFLSFPYGDFNETHVNMAKNAGYKKVFSILPNLAKHPRYIAGRVNVDPSDWSVEFKLKIRGAYRWLPKAYTLKKTIKTWKS